MNIFISWSGKDAYIVAAQLKKAISKCLPINETDIYFSPHDKVRGRISSPSEEIRRHDFAIFLLNSENKRTFCVNKEYENFKETHDQGYIDKYSYIISLPDFTTTEDGRFGSLEATAFIGRSSIRYNRDDLRLMFSHLANLLKCKCDISVAFQGVWEKYLIPSKLQKIKEATINQKQKKAQKQVESKEKYSSIFEPNLKQTSSYQTDSVPLNKASFPASAAVYDIEVTILSISDIVKDSECKGATLLNTLDDIFSSKGLRKELNVFRAALAHKATLLSPDCIINRPVPILGNLT